MRMAILMSSMLIAGAINKSTFTGVEFELRVMLYIFLAMDLLEFIWTLNNRVKK